MSEALPQSPPFHPEIDELRHPELAIWKTNVGAPITLDLAAPCESVRSVWVLNWNVAIGEADLPAVVKRILEGGFGANVSTTDPLICLIQEAFRSDETIPEFPATHHHGGKAPASGRHDICDVARGFGFSLRYAPSMRNGRHRSDRGNAILSTAALGTAHAFLLPYVRQRRVLVAAGIHGLESMWFASAHLDTGGRPREGRLRGYGAGRVSQIESAIADLKALDGDVLVGADLNSPLGARDPAVRTLVSAGFQDADRTHAWRHTFHGPIRMLLDHVLWLPRSDRIKSVSLQRLDETSNDRTRRIFGSDHHPLLAHIQL